MLKKRRSSFIAIILTLVLLAGVAVLPAFAANDNDYRIVLKYYDDIQVTYTINYPAEGPKTSPADIPIGGIGKPDPGNEFGINPYLCTQVYCVDPFTAFHGNIGVGGGNSGWITGGSQDTVMGYVSAAPWNQSGALQTYGAAVGWIVANGYRGTYNHGGTDDAESQESVARLNAMFPEIGDIDKEIALMATKVAIWKTIAGNSVMVEKTTLDDTPKREKFDALVAALVDAGASPQTLPGEARVTTFEIKIVESASAFYDDEAGTAYSFYGPLTVQGTLNNARAGISDLTKVFVTANGTNSDGVMFLKKKTNNPSDELPKDQIFGTTRTAGYLTGSGSGNTWTSEEFYLAIPKSRTPERGDRLQIEAFAKAPGVEVTQGTPIVFAFAENDVQDWEAIQAFVGAASSGSSADLYATTVWSTGSTSLGELQIAKQVDNALPANHDHLFTFAVYYNDNTDFGTAKRLNLRDYNVIGAHSVNTTNNTFTLKNGGKAIIKGLPMAVTGGDTNYEYSYWVEELGLLQHYETPYIVLNTGKPAGLMATGFRIGPFQMDTRASVGFVTATNTYEEPTTPDVPGEMIIRKRLAGSYDEWGVDDSTIFMIKIWDVTRENYLLFKTVPEADGSYRCIGNDVDGLSEPYSGRTTTELPLSVLKPLGITNLWLGAEYVVEEIEVPNCDTEYIGNGSIYIGGQVSNITVVNTYDRGTGVLVINKRLEGDYESWDVDRITPFGIRIKDVTRDNYLLFKATPEADGSYMCVGNDVDGVSEDYSGATVSELTVSAARPLMVTNLWTGLTYMVEELDGYGYDVVYIDNGATFQDGQNSVLTLINTYLPDGPGPGDPGEPGEPEEPEEPDEPPSGVPPTGDNYTPFAAIALLIAGTGIITSAEVLRRRRNRKSNQG